MTAGVEQCPRYLHVKYDESPALQIDMLIGIMRRGVLRQEFVADEVSNADPEHIYLKHMH